jgi:hypothetical protein
MTTTRGSLVEAWRTMELERQSQKMKNATERRMEEEKQKLSEDSVCNKNTAFFGARKTEEAHTQEEARKVVSPDLAMDVDNNKPD